jgi:hypothetical protein
MSTSLPAPAGAEGYAPSQTELPSVVAEYGLGPFESLVATLSTRRDGRRVAAIVRVKNTPDGLRRMACLEWGEHRTIAVASLIDELLRAIAKRDGG